MGGNRTPEPVRWRDLRRDVATNRAELHGWHGIPTFWICGRWTTCRDFCAQRDRPQGLSKRVWWLAGELRVHATGHRNGGRSGDAGSRLRAVATRLRPASGAGERSAIQSGKSGTGKKSGFSRRGPCPAISRHQRQLARSRNVREDHRRALVDLLAVAIKNSPIAPPLVGVAKQCGRLTLEPPCPKRQAPRHPRGVLN